MFFLPPPPKSCSKNLPKAVDVPPIKGTKKRDLHAAAEKNKSAARKLLKVVSDKDKEIKEWSNLVKEFVKGKESAIKRQGTENDNLARAKSKVEVELESAKRAKMQLSKELTQSHNRTKKLQASIFKLEDEKRALQNRVLVAGSADSKPKGQSQKPSSSSVLTERKKSEIRITEMREKARIKQQAEWDEMERKRIRDEHAVQKNKAKYAYASVAGSGLQHGDWRCMIGKNVSSFCL